MALDHLSPSALDQVARYFQALSEPSRLAILNVLRDGERSVGDIAGALGCSLANASRHLSVLTQHGIIERESRGVLVYYRIADPSVDALCDLVCASIARRLERTAPARELLLNVRDANRAASVVNMRRQPRTRRSAA